MGREDHLPTELLPRNTNRREFRPGKDLPCWFHNELKSLDKCLYFVWHPYRLLYDDVMTPYTGSLEDPRFSIHQEYGVEVWGYPVTHGDGTPILENKWHIWRLCKPYGWCHVSNVASKESEYLNLLLKRLYRQAKIRDVGRREWMRLEQEERDRRMQQQQQEADELFDAVQEENKWFMRKAMENYDRGIVAPTNPQHEHIISYPGQKNRSRIIRPLHDTEGGLVIPEDWKKS